MARLLYDAGMIRWIAACFLLSAVAFAQTGPEFEVASIRPSSDQVTQVAVGLAISGSQVRITYLTVRDYIAMAYDMRLNQVVGPDFINETRFDIAAKIPDGMSRDQVPAMLQALLADRFQMKAHRESREFPVYALTVGRDGLRMKELPAASSQTDAPLTVGAIGDGRSVSVDLGGGSAFRLADNRIEARRITMTDLASMLTRFVDRPVIDETKLTGRYDVTAPIAPEDYMPMMIRGAVNGGVALPPQALRLLDGASPDPLSGPLQTVGLRLESRRAPLDVLVVDSILRMPTDN